MCSGPSVLKYAGTLIICTGMMTVQLESFVKTVRFIGVFECTSVSKCMGFNNLSFSVIRAHPGPNEFG